MFQHIYRTQTPPMLQHAREIAPSVSWEILGLVKRSGGMCVKELSAKLKMSYMGVKQHCDDLKRRGYLDTWRRPKKTGRPEKIYRPAEKLDLVLPNWGSELSLGLLALVAQHYGETVPERLLYGFLQQKVERWNSKLKAKKLADRAQELAKLRNADGWMCEVFDDAEGLRLVDHHTPLAEVARLYPALPELELRVLSRVFGHTLVRRTNGTHVEFVISQPETAAAPTTPPPVLPEETKPAVTRRTAKAEKPAKAAAPAPAPTPITPPQREMLDLELIGSSSGTSHRRHRDDLFEL
jgi:predicted ArsR family transcriptional regulator